MFLFCLAQAAGTVSIGFYQTTANGGLIVGAGTQMQSLLSVAAAVTGAQVAFGNTAIVDYSNIEKQLWQYLGLTADPLIDYDICITPGTAWTNGGITGLITNYTI